MCKNLFRILSVSCVALMLFACESNTDDTGSLVIERDLQLSSLSVDAGDLSPEFSSDNVGPYSIEVGVDTTEIQFNVGSPGETNNVNMFAYRRVAVAANNANTNDGRIDEQVIEAESSFSFILEPGENLFGVRVQLDNEEQLLDYLVNVRRVSNVATLSDLSFEDFTTDENEDLEFISPTAFSSDVFEYNLSVPFSRCTIGVTAFGADRFTSVTIEGEEVPRGAQRYFDLDVGDNTLQIDVTSEDGSATNTYQVNINRGEASSTDNENNLTLSALTFSVGDLTSSVGSEGFNCLLSAYAIRIDNDQNGVDVSAIPSIAGRTVELANVVVTEDADGNQETTLENPRELVSGVPLNLVISENEEDNVYAISVERNSNNELQSNYNFTLLRSDTNRVVVNTGAELQAALQNALPNQEIVIDADGELTAEATLAESGKEGVHFYANVSGTAEQPIILRGSSNFTLTGSGLAEGTVFELAGDYWELRNLDISSAAYGLVLDSASNNELHDIDVSDIGLRGVQLKNGSHDNFLNEFEISNIGAAATAGSNNGQALVVGSNPTNWNTNPTPGSDEPSNLRNAFSNFEMGENILGEPLVIEAGADSSTFFGFVIDAGDISEVAAQNTAVRIQGNNTELAYSTLLDSAAALDAAVIVEDIDEAWVTEAWAEEARVFDNVLDSAQITLATVAANANVENVEVDDNIRVDGLDSVYSGAAIDQSFESPLYTIQWVSPDDSQTYCLQREETTVVATEASAVLVTAATCDGSQGQRWDLIHEGDQNLVIRSQAAQTAKLSPLNDGAFRSASSGADTLALKEDEDTQEFASASSLRWKINFVDRNTVYFANQFGPAYSITMIDAGDVYATDNSIAAIALFTRSDLQIFTLVPVN